jgi:hypothetical protein
MSIFNIQNKILKKFWFLNIKKLPFTLIHSFYITWKQRLFQNGFHHWTGKMNKGSIYLHVDIKVKAVEKIMKPTEIDDCSSSDLFLYTVTYQNLAV